MPRLLALWHPVRPGVVFIGHVSAVWWVFLVAAGVLGIAGLYQQVLLVLATICLLVGVVGGVTTLRRQEPLRAPSERFSDQIREEGRAALARKRGVALAEFSERERHAIETLSNYATEHARVDVTLFPVSQMPIATRIANLFQLAGWSTNFNTRPQESANPIYVEGVQVRGHNAHLLARIAGALSTAGIEASALPSATGVPEDSPKYPFALAKVEIVVGHPAGRER